MKKINQAFKTNVFNEEAMFKRMNLNYVPTHKAFSFDRLIYGALSLLLVSGLTIGLVKPINTQAVYSILTVDINPSIELMINKDNQVISYKGINAEGVGLNLDEYVGQDAVSVVDAIIRLATQAGYIKTTDFIDDYILVTTVNMNSRHPETTDQLDIDLEEATLTYSNMKLVNMVIMKANKTELDDAEAKSIPVGLFILNGLVNINGQTMSVSEYFSKQSNIDDLNEDQEHEVEIISKSYESTLELINQFMAKLKAASYDVSALQVRLDANQNIYTILYDIKQIWTGLGLDDLDDDVPEYQEKQSEVQEEISEMLIELAKLGYNISDYQTALENSSTDFFLLKKQVENSLDSYCVNEESHQSIEPDQFNNMKSEIAEEIDELKEYGIDTSNYQTRLDNVSANTIYALLNEVEKAVDVAKEGNQDEVDND